MSRERSAPEHGLSQAIVLTKAVVNAADHLALGSRDLGSVIGLDEASIERMRQGALHLDPGSKTYELGVLFVRLFRSLDAIVGGDVSVAREWLANENTALGAAPLAHIRTIQGLTDAVGYLDARRAVV